MRLRNIAKRCRPTNGCASTPAKDVVFKKQKPGGFIDREYTASHEASFMALIKVCTSVKGAAFECQFADLFHVPVLKQVLGRKVVPVTHA
jgi:hypothetical protein